MLAPFVVIRSNEVYGEIRRKTLSECKIDRFSRDFRTVFAQTPSKKGFASFFRAARRKILRSDGTTSHSAPSPPAPAELCRRHRRPALPRWCPRMRVTNAAGRNTADFDS
jgi:hypothetical protein